MTKKNPKEDFAPTPELNKRDRRVLRRAHNGLSKPGTLPEKRLNKLKDLLPESHKPKRKKTVTFV